MKYRHYKKSLKLAYYLKGNLGRRIQILNVRGAHLKHKHELRCWRKWEAA